MKIMYMAAGAFLEWVIRTQEGKDFANKVISKGYEAIKESVKDAVPKSKLSTGIDGAVLPNIGCSRSDKHISKCSTQGIAKDIQGITTSEQRLSGINDAGA
ncbi:MAG: hypothetical protein NC124_02245 [Clostridium sp.]|nr:hypothetical protein [Clostridium sp.]